MDNDLRDTLDKMAADAQKKADRARANKDKFNGLASQYTEQRNTAAAHQCQVAARGYLNDYFFWKGQAVALQGVSAGLGLRGIVEEEMEGEATCP
jgi:hypothetical protein